MMQSAKDWCKEMPNCAGPSLHARRRWVPCPKTPQKGSGRHQRDVQTKRAMVLIREAGMRSIGVKHLEQAIDVVLAVRGPFVPVNGKETDRRLGEHRATVFGRRQGICAGAVYVARDVI